MLNTESTDAKQLHLEVVVALNDTSKEMVFSKASLDPAGRASPSSQIWEWIHGTPLRWIIFTSSQELSKMHQNQVLF